MTTPQNLNLSLMKCFDFIICYWEVSTLLEPFLFCLDTYPPTHPSFPLLIANSVFLKQTKLGNLSGFE